MAAAVLETAHSRFPAIEGERDKVVGILLAKDLLRYYAEESFDVRDMLRPAIFIPESKRLNVLLRDFRANHNHMAIVVDEYSGVAGLITIEDVLEQIVGDIEDEYDFDEEEDNILSIKEGQLGPRWRVKALTEIDQFNEESASTCRKTTSTPSAAWWPATWAACRTRARCSTSTTCASKCCAPTRARSTCCWSKNCPPPTTHD
jgi:Mg2+/Co2+ transporter CorC